MKTTILIQIKIINTTFNLNKLKGAEEEATEPVGFAPLVSIF